MMTEPPLRVNFSLQHQNLALTEWIALITLCLAPLIAHLIAGGPQVIYLHDSVPRWHDSIVLYNPISIMWRYYAIMERGWSLRDIVHSELAAINVVYWTSQGWGGSESNIQQGQFLCVRRPPRAQERILSSGGLKTLIVAVQGTAAAGALLPGKLQHHQNSITAIFGPLAFIGLIRLPAAYWLTDDFHIIHMFERLYDTGQPASMNTHKLVPLLRMYSSGSNEPPLVGQTVEDSTQRYRPGIPAYITRIVYSAFFLFSLGVGIYQLIWPILEGKAFTLTQLWMVLSYIVFLISVISICLPHLWRMQAQPTCIPCVNKLWYKIHTGVLIMLALLCFVIAALETKKDLRGSYSSYPVSAGAWKCEYSESGNRTVMGCFKWRNGRTEPC